MTPQEFCYWLQGYAEMGGAAPTEEQWKMIKEHLKLVFNKVTPDLGESEPKNTGWSDKKIDIVDILKDVGKSPAPAPTPYKPEPFTPLTPGPVVYPPYPHQPYWYDTGTPRRDVTITC